MPRRFVETTMRHAFEHSRSQRRYFAASIHATARRLPLPLNVAQLLDVIDMSRELAILRNHSTNSLYQTLQIG
jgi:hypothetical protein